MVVGVEKVEEKKSGDVSDEEMRWRREAEEPEK